MGGQGRAGQGRAKSSRGTAHCRCVGAGQGRAGHCWTADYRAGRGRPPRLAFVHPFHVEILSLIRHLRGDRAVLSEISFPPLA